MQLGLHHCLLLTVLKLQWQYRVSSVRLDAAISQLWTKMLFGSHLNSLLYSKGLTIKIFDISNVLLLNFFEGKVENEIKVTTHSKSVMRNEKFVRFV